MSEEVQSIVPDNQEIRQNDKEYNFAQVRRQLDQEREARVAAEKEAADLRRSLTQRIPVDEDEDDEPYIDKKRLKKELYSFEKKMDEMIEQKAEQKARALVDEERKSSWLKNNPDFYEVMGHVQAFAEKDPELAETILQMPDGFERQKLVYKNIKALGIHKKPDPQPSIQETVDRNRRSPYYQPPTMGAPPYAAAGDFSQAGQKNAYDKMKEMQARLHGIR